MKKTLLISCLIVSLIGSLMIASNFAIFSVQGSTEVAGIIASDTTWTLANSPYDLTGHILVDEGVTLIIEPGVNINFNGYYMNVGGRLSANGTETEKIVMKGSGRSYSGDWNGRISFLSTSYNSTIEYAEITSTPADAISVQGDSHKISNNIMNNISLSIYECSAVISGNTICGHEIRGIGVGGYTMGEPVVITGNIVANNGIGITLAYASNSPIVSNNVIFGNAFGIFLDSMPSDATIINNVIMNNRGPLLKGYPSPIITEGAGILIVSSSNLEFDIRNNTICNNKYGIDIRGAPHSIITQNNIFENDDYNVFNTLPDDVNASNNWWGTTNTSAIDQSIYDLYDDFNLGEVTYLPILEQHNPNAPMAPAVYSYDVSVETQSYKIAALSTSNITEFDFNKDSKLLEFNAEGATGTTGFCRITIPEDLMFGTFTLYEDDTLLIKDLDYTETHNGTHYIFQIFYNHSVHTFQIFSSEVIPELPPGLLLALVLISMFAGVVLIREKLLKTQSHLLSS